MGYWSNLFKSSSKGALRGGANTLAVAGNVGGAAFGFMGQCGPDKLILKAFGTIGAAAGVVPGALAAPFWFAANAVTRQPHFKNNRHSIDTFKSQVKTKLGQLTDEALTTFFESIVTGYQPRNSSAHSRHLIKTLSGGESANLTITTTDKVNVLMAYLFKEKNGALVNDGKRLFNLIKNKLDVQSAEDSSTARDFDEPCEFDASPEYRNGPHHFLKI